MMIRIFCCLDQFIFHPVRFLHCDTSESWPMAEELQDPQPASDSAHRASVSELLVNNLEKQTNKYVIIQTWSLERKQTCKEPDLSVLPWQPVPACSTHFVAQAFALQSELSYHGNEDIQKDA